MTRAIGPIAVLLAAWLGACAAPATPTTPPAPVAPAAAPPAPGASAPSPASPPLLAKLHVPHSSISQTHLPIWMAVEQGYFRQYGLDLETSYVAGGQTIAASLASGETPIILSGAAGPLLAAAQGADFVFVGTGSEALPFRLMAHPSITTRDDLRGKGIAVAGRGSTLETAGLLLLADWGWERNQDVRLVNTGSTPNVYQALVSGATEAAIVPDPYGVDADRQGYRTLYDVMDLPVPYAASCIITSRGYLARERAVVRAFLQGYVEGAARTLADTPTALAVLNQYIPFDDPTIAEVGWERGRREIRVVPRVSPRGLETVRRIAADDSPALATFDVARVADPSLLEELEANGFVDAVLRQYGLSR